MAVARVADHRHRVQQHHKLAARALGRPIQPRGQRLRGLGGDFFKLLGQLARQGDGALAQHSQGLGQLADAVRRFEQHHAPGLLGQLLRNHVGALRVLDGQEACKHKAAMLGAVGHGTRHAQCGGDAARARQRYGAQACGLHGSHQACAGVAHAGGARVAHIGHALALLQPVHHVLRGFGLVVLVHGQQLAGALVDAVGTQHGLRVARVLASHRVGQLQHVQGPQGDVGQVADGRGHHVQRALRIMLRSGGVVRRALG